MEKSEYYDNGIDTRNGLPYGETEDNTPFLDKVNKKMRKLHEEFVEKNGSEPHFADVVVKFDGEDEEFSTLIKIKGYNPQDTENDPDDGNVIFYADGINELCQINTDRIADFIITDINEFSDSY
jgi:hypothetical protein